MSRVNRILPILSRMFSSDLLFWMTAAWILLYVTFAVWGEEAFSRYVSVLSTTLLMQIVFVIFIIVFAVNCGIFVLRRISVSWRTAILWVTLPVGFLLYLTGFFLSAVFSDTQRAFVGQGDVVNPQLITESYVLTDIDSGLGKEYVDMDTGDSALFSYEPRVYLDRGRVRHEVGVFPPTRIGSAYFHILDFGLAPGVRLSRNDIVVSQEYVIQRLFPPGNRDSFELSPLPYRFAINLMPSRKAVKGTLSAEVYDIDNPRFEVIIQKGEDVIYKGESMQDILFDGYRLEFFTPTYWVWLEASSNPGLVILAVGLTLIIFGFPMTVLAMGGRMFYSGLKDGDK